MRYLLESCDPRRLLNNPLKGFTLLTTMGPSSLLFSRLLTNSIHRALSPIVHVLAPNSHRDPLVMLNNDKNVGDVFHCSPIAYSIGCHYSQSWRWGEGLWSSTHMKTLNRLCWVLLVHFGVSFHLLLPFFPVFSYRNCRQLQYVPREKNLYT